MFPNLMANFEDDDVFPETDKYLFIGGPKHGEYVEVVRGDLVHKCIVSPLTGGAAEVHTYIRRDITAQLNGETYARDVYMHEQCPNPQVAEQLLMSALMVAFIKGGRKVVTVDGESG
jgi:hypothetical protein